MVWYDPMFLGTGCQSKLNMLKRRISRREVHTGVFLITLPTCDGRVLEIIPSALLVQDHYPADNLRIIGMAFSRNEAIGIAQEIISECYRECGKIDVEAYMDSYSGRRK